MLLRPVAPAQTRRRPHLPVLLLAALLLAPTIATAAPIELALCYEDENVRPWRTRDGGGLNFELLDQVATSLGLRFRYIGMPWKRCLHELKNNEYAGAIGASFKPERQANGTYPAAAHDMQKADAGRALYAERYIVIRRKGSAVDWDGRSFSPLRLPVGAPLGYSVVDDLRRTGIAVDDGTHGVPDLLHKLLLARIDAAVLLQGELETVLAANPPLREKLEILPQPFAEKPYYLLLSHRLLRAEPELAQRIWQGVARERAAPAWQDKERRALGALRSGGQ